jgi:hypothetical protein
MHDVCVNKKYLTQTIDASSLVRSASFRGQGLITTPHFSPEYLSKTLRKFNKAIFVQAFIGLLIHPSRAIRAIGIALRALPHFKRYVFG